MLEVSVLRWTITIGLILGLLALDLGLAAARPHVVKFREAAISSILYIAVALAFGLVFAMQVGWNYGAEYFAGPRSRHNEAGPAGGRPAGYRVARILIRAPRS